MHDWDTLPKKWDLKTIGLNIFHDEHGATMGKANTEISPLIRQYSMKAEQEEPNNMLVQAVSSTIRKQDEEDLCDRRQVWEWSKWLKFGESTE